jgi:DNA-binding MarR family transcriptional regulator
MNSVPNLTVKLVTQWGKFEAEHPNATLEEFYRFQLYQLKNTRTKKSTLPDKNIIQEPRIRIGILLSRISKLMTFFMEMAMQKIPLKQFEEFLILTSINHLGEPKKTEVIHHIMMELTTGLNLIKQLDNQGLLTEYNDPRDKRSRRLKLTNKGKKILEKCYLHFGSANTELFRVMPEQEVELAIQLLSGVEIQASKDWEKQRKTRKIQLS